MVSAAKHDADALSVREAELAMLRRTGARNRMLLRRTILRTRIISSTLEQALRMQSDVHSDA